MFSKQRFSEWCVQRVVRIHKGRRHQNALKHPNGKEKKPINIKNFGGTPPGVRPVCPGDTSHLSRDVSRLSRGQSVPLALIYT